MSSRRSENLLELVEGVVGHLQRRFPMLGEADCEDLAQEAYTQLLEGQGNGARVEEPAAMLRTISAAAESCVYKRAQEPKRR